MSAQPVNIHTIPNDVFNYLLRFFQTEEYFFLRLVCKRWSRLIRQKATPIEQIISYYAAFGSLGAITLLQSILTDDRIFRNSTLFQTQQRHILEWSFQRIKSNPKFHESAAAGYDEAGHLSYLQSLSDLDYTIGLLTSAVAGGHLIIIQHIIDNILFEKPLVDYSVLCSTATKYGHLHILKYLHELGVNWTYLTCSHASQYGHLAILKYARENGCNWTYHCGFYAAKAGYLDILEWIIANNGDASCVCSGAAAGGHLDVLKWARLHNIEWKDTASIASRYGHIDLMKWAIENGCEWSGSICSVAASRGDLELIKYAKDKGYDWNIDLCASAARNGCLEVIQWARDNGCYWNAETCEEAVLGGQLEMLSYARNNGCDWNVATFHAALLQKNEEIIDYLVENECPTDQKCVKYAVEAGSLKALEMLRLQGRQFGEACALALQHNKLDVLKWLKKHGLEWKKDICQTAAERGNLEILKWAFENGCKLPPYGQTVAMTLTANNVNAKQKTSYIQVIVIIAVLYKRLLHR